MSMHMRGAPMDEIWAASERFLEVLKPANLREPIGTIHAVRQTIRNLRGQTKTRTSWTDEDFDDILHLAQLASYGSRHFAHFSFITRMQTLYLWGEHEDALAIAQISQRYLKESPGMLHSAEHHFWHALILAGLCPRRGFVRRWLLCRTLRKTHRKSEQCPNNFQAKERLLAAEIARLDGHDAQAVEFYQAAIAAAKSYGYRQVEALAQERLASLHRERGRSAEAALALDAACAAYRRWGADALAQRLVGDPGGKAD